MSDSSNASGFVSKAPVIFSFLQDHDIPADSFDSLDATEAFNVFRSEIEGVTPNMLVTLNTDVGGVVRSIMFATQRLEPLVDELTAAVPSYKFQQKIRRLRTAGMALNFLQAEFRMQRSTVDTELIAFLLERRTLLHAYAEPLVLSGIITRQQLNDLKHPNNHEALGHDVMGLSTVLLNNFDEVASKHLTRELLLESRIQGNALFIQLANREFGPESTEQVRLLRHKAYSLAHHLFNNLERAVGHARSHYGDGSELMPSLYSKKGPRKVDEQDAFPADGPMPTAPTTPDPTLTPNTNVDADLAAINQRVAQAGPSRPGGPGGLPFRLTEDGADANG